MSDCTSSEDDPFDDAVDTLDPDPTISVLGITTTECSIIASVLPLAFKTPTIQTFFAKASKHEGATCLTSIDYKHVTTAHIRQITIIDKLRSDNDHLRQRLAFVTELNKSQSTTIDKLNSNDRSHREQINALTADIASLKAKLHSALTSSFTATSRASLLTQSLEDVKSSNQQLRKEIEILTAPTQTSSIATQTVSMTIDSATQTDVATIDTASQTTAATKTDSVTQTDPVTAAAATTLILPSKPTPAASLPSVTHPMSYAQATATSGLTLTPTKPGLSKALAKHVNATQTAPSIPTSTIPLPTSEPAFKGRRGTKPSELHLQFVSRTDFVNKLQAKYDGKINHRHALKDAFIKILNRVSERLCKRTSKPNKIAVRDILRNNYIDAIFWSPRGNLIIRAKRAIGPVSLEVITATITYISGREDSFVILHRPPLSMLRITDFPTTLSDGQAADPERILMDLFDDPRLKLASFWHTPRFVTFKGMKPGVTGTLFFSVVDSPDHALGRSLVNSSVNVYDHQFTLRQWHSRHSEFPRLPPSSFYKQ